MRPKRILLLAAGAALLGSLVPAQESKPFLTPAEVLKMMGESKTEYVVNSLEKLKPEEMKDLAGLFFAQRCPDIENPRLVSEKGKPAVKEYSFKKEAVKLFEQAEAVFKKKDYDGARALYEQALRADPAFYLALGYIGDTYLYTGRVEEALAAYDKAIEMNPYDHRLYFFRANTLGRAGRQDEARKDIVRALALRPRYRFVLQVANSDKAPYGFRLRETNFEPPVLARKEGAKVAIYIDPNESNSHWGAYALAKALWLGEPKHRKEMTGSDGPGWSTTEERECLANLMAVYEDLLEKKTIEPDPRLETLRQIVENEDLNGFILYEVYSRLCPSAMLTLSEENRKLVERYIEKYLIVPLS